jgi:excisionase family DNA binding protein
MEQPAVSDEAALAAARDELARATDALVQACHAVEEAREVVRRLEVEVAPNALAATLSTAEAAERAGCSADTIVRWCRDDGIGFKLGGRWYIDPKKLHAFIGEL